MSLTRRWGAIAAGAAVSLATTVALAAQWLVIGSRDGGWVYDYVEPFSPAAVVPWLVIAAVVAALLWLHRYLERSPWLLLAVWILATTGLHGVVRGQAKYDLESLFVSPAANSFYTVTQQHPPGDVLARFARVRSTAPLHMRSNMPGKTMLLYALEAVTSRTDILPWLIVLISNAGALLMFLFVRDLCDDRNVALHAAILYLFVPARLFFFPLMNTVTPVIALAYAWLVVRWLRSGRWRDALLSAVALYGLVFFEPLPLVLGLLIVALAIRSIAGGHQNSARFVLQASATVIAFIAVAETVLFLFGFNLIGAMRQIGKHAVEFNAQDGRPYGVWVHANLVEFAFGVGACQLILCMVAAGSALRGGEWRRRLRHPVALVSIVLLLTVVITDLIGVNRGEVLRLWIFLACFFQIPAAYVTATMSRAALCVVVLATALPVVVAVATVAFVIP